MGFYAWQGRKTDDGQEVASVRAELSGLKAMERQVSRSLTAMKIRKVRSALNTQIPADPVAVARFRSHAPRTDLQHLGVYLRHLLLGSARHVSPVHLLHPDPRVSRRRRVPAAEQGQHERRLDLFPPRPRTQPPANRLGRYRRGRMVAGHITALDGTPDPQQSRPGLEEPHARAQTDQQNCRRGLSPPQPRPAVRALSPLL